MNMIEIKNISKSYPLYKTKKNKLKEALSISNKSYHSDFFALNDISFSVSKGECIGIIGLNGSGKSTLLKIVTGVISPSSGEVVIRGKVSALLELGAGFNPEYTGMENIYLNSMLMGYSREETDSRIDSILDFADIGDFIHQPVKTYSSGMFIRLAFSIAINVEPDILIIDEALSVGDVFFQQKCYKKIRELTGNATVLIVSHDLNAMTKFCRRIIVMHRGNAIFDGKPQEAITRYFQVKQGAFKKPSTKKDFTSVDFQKYHTPLPEQYSGNMKVIIEKYYYEIDGIPFHEMCQKDSAVQISLLVSAQCPLEDLIIGYQARDKYGNEIFGQTSLTSHVEQFSLPIGHSAISFEFTWPEVREGDYFITLGLGNGTDVLNQVEECWINNALHIISNVGGKTIFGIFNQEMENVHISTFD